MHSIRNIVTFNLIYQDGDSKIDEFFKAAKELVGSIPYVAEYHQYIQTNEEAPYKYGFILEFISEEDMHNYFYYPSHMEFAEKYWDSGVKDFLDYSFVEFE